MKKTIIIAFLSSIFLIGLIFNGPSRVSEEKMIKFKDSRCVDNLRRIYLSFQCYFNDFGEWPDSLNSLKDSVGANVEENLFCPIDKNNYIYVYPTYRKDNNSNIVPILRDKKSIYRNFINVLMSDSGVMTIPEDKLDISIVEYNKQAERNRRPFQK